MDFNRKEHTLKSGLPNLLFVIYCLVFHLAAI
jgi:hypothetical protein